MTDAELRKLCEEMLALARTADIPKPGITYREYAAAYGATLARALLSRLEADHG